ncbi:MAG TPA: D-alanyl-D-alanine carboxypeptidase family protein [Thermoclostridium sp.]|nr:D-alanyl-D-alanine carboxypeptidase family protein [Thermoclostridium sp.]HPU44968.1 D-alanyl-D-alanine carboxypeptidase family protein [Thermoclostridium sp.]
MKRLSAAYFLLAFLIFFQIRLPVFADEVPDIKAEAFILIDMETGEVLCEKEADQKRSPASTTKILTAIIALERAGLDTEMTASQTAINSVDIYNYVTAGIKPGETIKLKNLLELMMVTSANEVGFIIAENVSPDGTIDGFVRLMNQKAGELGLTGSHFTNPCGLEDPDHYSTARDLAILGREAMKYDAFREIVGKTEITMPDTNFRKSSDWNAGYLTFTNRLLTSRSKYYSQVTGIKTGYTNPAGRCLVASAVNPEGMELISVVLGADVENPNVVFEESQKLLEYGFANYSVQDVVKDGEYVGREEVADAVEAQRVEMITQGSIRYILPLDSERLNQELVKEKKLNEPFKAPIEKGQVLGTIEYFYKGKSLGTVNIVANNSIEKTTIAQIRDKYMEIVSDERFILGLKIAGGVIVFLIILRIILKIVSRRSGRRRRYSSYSSSRRKNVRFKDFR